MAGDLLVCKQITSPLTTAGQRLKPVLIHTKLGADAQMFREAVYVMIKTLTVVIRCCRPSDMTGRTRTYQERNGHVKLRH